MNRSEENANNLLFTMRLLVPYCIFGFFGMAWSSLDKWLVRLLVGEDGLVVIKSITVEDDC